jgi:hypothetical protein
VECRTPLATLRHLFLTPARKCEPKKYGSKKKGGAKNNNGSNKKIESKKLLFWEMYSLSKRRT